MKLHILMATAMIALPLASGTAAYAFEPDPYLEYAPPTDPVIVKTPEEIDEALTDYCKGTKAPGDKIKCKIVKGDDSPTGQPIWQLTDPAGDIMPIYIHCAPRNVGKLEADCEALDKKDNKDDYDLIFPGIKNH